MVQMILYVGGALVSFFVMLHMLPGGWPHVLQVGEAAHKFQMFDFRFSLDPAFFHHTYSFWAGVLGGCFLTTASHGTEQLLVQRLLAARNEPDARRALMVSWVLVLFQFALFLIIGVLLFVSHQQNNYRPRLFQSGPTQSSSGSICRSALQVSDRGNSRRRHVQFECGAKCVVFDDRHGLRPSATAKPPEDLIYGLRAGPPSVGVSFCSWLDSWPAIGAVSWRRGCPLPLSSTAPCWASFFWESLLKPR